MMVKPGLGMTVFGDYAYNIDGDDRRKAWIDLRWGNDGGADDIQHFC